MGNSENAMIVDELSPIENLPDDCLRIIFQYLPIFDKIKIESVSKRWQRLSRESWYLFKSLDMSTQSWGVTCKTQIDNEILSKVLSRCSQYITAVNFAKKSFPPSKRILFPNFNSTTIIIICSSCPNMNALNISDLTILWDNGHISRMMRFMFLNACERRMVCDEVDQRECERTFCLCRLQNSSINRFKSRQKEENMILESLISCCQNLKEFGMRMFFYDETHLWIKLLKTMTNIKRLSLTEFPGTLFAYLSFETIEELLLKGNDGIFPAHLGNIITSFKKLKTLVLNSSRFINDVGMRNLLTQAGTMENLGLIRDSNFLTIEGVNNIPRFSNLRKLNVYGNNLIDDSILESLAVNCEQLIFLNISSCKKVTDNGVLSISTLPELQFLIISRSVSVTDKYLGNLHHLRVLDCQHCPLIRDEGLCILLERARDLRVLILEGCIRVTENVFDTAVDVIESGFRRITLHISMSSHIDFDVKKFNYASPLLRIVKDVKYQDSCPMDFKNEYFPVNDDNYIFSDFPTDDQMLT